MDGFAATLKVTNTLSYLISLCILCMHVSVHVILCVFVWIYICVCSRMSLCDVFMWI